MKGFNGRDFNGRDFNGRDFNGRDFNGTVRACPSASLRAGLRAP